MPTPTHLAALAAMFAHLPKGLDARQAWKLDPVACARAADYIDANRDGITREIADRLAGGGE